MSAHIILVSSLRLDYRLNNVDQFQSTHIIASAHYTDSDVGVYVFSLRMCARNRIDMKN